MQFLFSFKRMDSSEALETYAINKLQEKIGKFVNKHIETHVTFDVDKHRHTARCRVKGGDGFNLEVQHSCTDMYWSVDKMVDKLESQLKKQKARIKTHKAKKSLNNYESNILEFDVEYESEAVDAEDILKYEQARKKAASH